MVRRGPRRGRGAEVTRAFYYWLVVSWFAGLLSLSACATPGPLRLQTVDRPVAVACVPRTLPPAPKDIADPKALAQLSDGPTRYVRISDAYLALYAWMLGAAPVVEACRLAPSSASPDQPPHP